MNRTHEGEHRGPAQQRQVYRSCRDCGGPVYGYYSKRCRGCWRENVRLTAQSKWESSGYIYVVVPGRGRVREHRLVMEQAIGRRLRPEEVVHHLNGDTRDNRLDNLELLPGNPEHRARHRRIDWDEVVALYQTGRGTTTVANHLGIGESTVFRIVKKRGVLRTRSASAALRPRAENGDFASWQ